MQSTRSSLRSRDTWALPTGSGTIPCRTTALRRISSPTPICRGRETSGASPKPTTPPDTCSATRRPCTASSAETTPSRTLPRAICWCSAAMIPERPEERQGRRLPKKGPREAGLQRARTACRSRSISAITGPGSRNIRQRRRSLSGRVCAGW